MENSKATIGALLLIIFVIGVNFFIYGIARSMAKPKKKSVLEILGQSFNTSTQKKDNSMDELHKKIEELEKSRKE